MATKVGNRDFQEAKRAKKDEFYTQLSDIDKELRYYHDHFRGQIVYLNCDDPRFSNFFRYFVDNFEKLGLKKIISSYYRNQNTGTLFEDKSDEAGWLEYCGSNRGSHALSPGEGNFKAFAADGDFRSPESVELLKQADIVVTNPPFSLFREYVAQLIEYEKKFLILGNMNAVTYKEIFPLFQDNRMWYGRSIRSGDREFRVPDDYPITTTGSRIDEQGNKFIRVKGVRWFTNLDYPERYEDLLLTKTYNAANYPKYANFDAIEVGKTADIPADYRGLMGVPISFLDKYNPSQFEIVGSSRTLGESMSKIAAKGTYQQGGPRFYIPNENGGFRRMYDRIVIRNKRL